MRCLIVSSLVVLTCLVHADGQDKKPTLIAGWGEVIDPAGDCKIVEKDGKVSITVPGTQHNLNPLPGWNNLDAPRVLQEADGDFTIQVKVGKFERPKANTSSNKEKPASFVAGGILVWQDDKNFLRCLRAGNGDRNDVFFSVEFFSKGKIIAAGGGKINDEDLYIRVERKKGRCSLSVSEDGEKWSPRRPPGKDIFLDGPVKAGVAVVNATTAEIVHQFSDLKLTKK